MDLTVDTTANDVVDDVKTTLSGVQVNAQPLFAGVLICESLAAFELVANANKGLIAGVIAGQPQRAMGTDNGEDHQTRLPIDVAVRLLSQRSPGTGNENAAKEMARVAELVRAALNADKTRGGRTSIVIFNGTYVPGTETKGDARFVQPKAGQAYYTALIPIACTWTTAL